MRPLRFCVRSLVLSKVVVADSGHVRHWGVKQTFLSPFWEILSRMPAITLIDLGEMLRDVVTNIVMKGWSWWTNLWWTCPWRQPLLLFLSFRYSSSPSVTPKPWLRWCFLLRLLRHILHHCLHHRLQVLISRTIHHQRSKDLQNERDCNIMLIGFIPLTSSYFQMQRHSRQVFLLLVTMVIGMDITKQDKTRIIIRFLEDNTTRMASITRLPILRSLRSPTMERMAWTRGSALVPWRSSLFGSP